MSFKVTKGEHAHFNIFIGVTIHSHQLKVSGQMFLNVQETLKICPNYV